MKKQIVRRTYSIMNGKKSNWVSYISSPKDIIGHETEHVAIKNAYLFDPEECYYDNRTVSGNDRSTGDYTYKQEVLNLEISIENEKKQ